MDKDLQQRVLVAVNGYLPQPINEYVEDSKGDKTAILNLVLTLKSWANPKGGYRPGLSKEELKDFDYILLILKDPKTLLSQEKHFKPGDEKEIDDLVRIKLDKIADELVKEYHLEQQLAEEINQASIVNDWWKQKSLEEKKQIQREYLQLSHSEQKEIEGQQQSANIYVYQNNVNLFPHFYMCNHHCHQRFLLLGETLRGAIELGRLMAPGIKAGVQAIKAGAEVIGHAVKSIGSGGGGGGGGGGGDGAVVALAIAAFVAIVSSGTIAGIYAIKKVYNSAKNLFHGDKAGRSIFRLGGIFGGGVGGAFGGAIIGAALGSVVPVIGTAAGAVIGAIFGSGLCAGLGALITKYIAKGISSIVYSNEINPSNPEKYKLNPEQIKKLEKKKLDVTVINQMIVALKSEKDKIGIEGSWPWSKARAEKDRWNALLKRIKNAEIEFPFPLDIGGVIYNPWVPSQKPKASPFLNSHAKMSQSGIAGNGEFLNEENPPAYNPDVGASSSFHWPAPSAPTRSLNLSKT